MSYIITPRCVKCGACEAECPNGAIREKGKQFAICQTRCVQCGACMSICPSGAVKETDHE